MTDDLFREEAVKAQSSDRWGRPVGLLPMAWSRITLLMLALITALLIFIGTASFSRKETVRGRLRPVEAEARVYAISPGLVKDLKVGLGDVVGEGDRLLTIGTDRTLESGGNIGEQTLAALRVEEASLKQRREGLIRSSSIDADQVKINLEQSQKDKVNMQETLDLTKRRLEIAIERVEAASPLVEKGLIPLDEMRRREEIEIQTRQAILQLKADIEQTDTQLKQLQLNAREVSEQLARDLASIDERLAQIGAQIASSQLESGYVVEAPVSGRIATLQASLGRRVEPSQPVMTILPVDSQLIAELYAPSRAIAFLKEGQEVRLQYDALPFEKFGAAFGHVSSISSTTLRPEELSDGAYSEEPVYRIKVALDQQSMNAFGENIPLQSGMELTADIVLEDRRLVEWLLEPLYAARQRMSG